MHRALTDRDMSDRRCVVCREPGTYKCPACKLRYCSLHCYNTHKESCTPVSTVPLPGSRSTATNHAAQAARHAAQAVTQTSTHHEEWNITVPESVLLAASNSSRVAQACRDDRLASLLRRIDDASDRASELAAIRAIDPDFEVFIQELLQDTGYLQCTEDPHGTISWQFTESPIPPGTK